jgi:hypothetical protein
MASSNSELKLDPKHGNPRARLDGDQHRWAIIWMRDRVCGEARREACVEMARTIARARTFAAPERISVAVLEQDRPWWSPATQGLLPGNIAEQPFDRGSGAGVLLAFLRIFRRDPSARITLLSVDPISLRELAVAHRELDALEAGEDDRFVRIGEGRLGVTSSTALLQLFRWSHPETLAIFMLRLEGTRLFDARALDLLYPFIPAFDLEEDILSNQPELVRYAMVSPPPAVRTSH